MARTETPSSDSGYATMLKPSSCSAAGGSSGVLPPPSNMFAICKAGQ